MDRDTIDALKRQPSANARLAYRLRNANVYVSPHGYHFTDYLNSVEEISPEIDASQLTAQEWKISNLSERHVFVALIWAQADLLDQRNARVIQIRWARRH